MKKGDHLLSRRFGFTHHGIYVGKGKVIHYAGLSAGFSKGGIEITSLADFAQNNEVRVKNYESREHTRKEIVERALSKLGQNTYNIFFNNCEHFVTWCIHGVHESEQVDDASIIAAIAGTSFTGYTLYSRAATTAAVVATTAKGASTAVAGAWAGAAVGAGAGAIVGTSTAAPIAAGAVALIGGSAVSVAAAPVVIGAAICGAIGWLFS